MRANSFHEIVFEPSEIRFRLIRAGTVRVLSELREHRVGRIEADAGVSTFLRRDS
jgi:hypothetical protein